MNLMFAGILLFQAAAVEAPPAESAVTSPEVRILDIVEIDGVRSNQLNGIGVVVGLLGTGDKGTATRTALSNYFKFNNLNVSPREVSSGNVALVSLTANLPPFAKRGTTLDVSVQSVGDASSLFGGTLLQAPLRGADGQVYLVVQGSVSVGGFSASGQAASVTQNHPVAGIVPRGGLVEREVAMRMIGDDGTMRLHLRSPNFMTAHRVAHELNLLAPGAARAVDMATIRVQVPEEWRVDPVGFLTLVGDQRVRPAEEAVVVINERTGTIVAGHNVRISTAAISHANLTIRIAESPLVSQPEPFSGGETTTVPRTDLSAEIDDREMLIVAGSTTVSELASALNKLGVTARDLLAIFQALDRAGYLHARMEVM